MRRPFRQVDVFGSGPFSGNPVAVIGEADGLSTEQMRAISTWTNLSECTFLLRPVAPEADYRVRIFNLDIELPFAGHPTLGTARAWSDLGGAPRRADGVIVQECDAGLVPVRRTGERFAFAAPPLVRSGPVDAGELREFLAVLGVDESEVVDAAWVDNGPGWVGILLSSAAAVLAVRPDAARARTPRHFDIGVVGPDDGDGDAAFEVRAFFSDRQGQLREDPVTGSLNASVARWLLDAGRARSPYVAAQGAALGRAGRVHVEQADDGLWIGGRTAVAVTGEIDDGTD